MEWPKLWLATIFFFSPVLAGHNSFLFFSFLFSFSPLNSRQLNCHNSFFFSTISAIPLPSFFFYLSPLSPTILATPLPQFLFFFFLSLLFSTSPISSTPLIWVACILRKNFDNYITEIQLSLSIPSSHHFSLLSYTFS